IVAGIWNPFSRDLLRGQVSSTSINFQVDPFWPKPLPNDWVTGNVGGTCVDANDHVFIVNRTADPNNLTAQEKEVGRPAPPVIEFDPEGNVVNFWADPKVVPSGIHDCYGNRRVVVFDRNGNYLRQFGRQATEAESEAGMGGAFLGIVHCLALANDGLLYVSDRDGKRIQVFDKMGNFKKNIFIKRRRADLPGNGSPWWILFSRDKAQKYMYVADGLNEVIWTLDRESGQTLSGFGRLGHMAGEFTFLHTIAMNSKGDLFIGETFGGRRVEKFKALAN